MSALMYRPVCDTCGPLSKFDSNDEAMSYGERHYVVSGHDTRVETVEQDSDPEILLWQDKYREADRAYIRANEEAHRQRERAASLDGMAARLADNVTAAEKEAARLRANHVATLARDFSLWLNGTYPPNLDAEAVHWRRVLKVAEEAGEVREAMGAWVQENPRKPAGSVEDVIKELADCVGAALGAIEHLTGHEGRSLDIATDRVRFVCERVGVRDRREPEDKAYCRSCGVVVSSNHVHDDGAGVSA